jgi:hypothetical protein
MDDEMVNHPKVNMGENVRHLLFVLISAGASNLCMSTIKTRSFSLYSHALYSSAHKNLRMSDRTCKGMSIRFLASGFPIYKKYDYETKNILKQMDIKLTPLTRSYLKSKNLNHSQHLTLKSLTAFDLKITHNDLNLFFLEQHMIN